MVPPWPLTHPWFALINQTPVRNAVVLLASWSQLRPALVVLRIVPSPPTTQQVWVLTNWMSSRNAKVPLVRGTQLAPLSMLARITPCGATIQPWLASVKKTERRSIGGVSGPWGNHVGVGADGTPPDTGIDTKTVIGRDVPDAPAMSVATAARLWKPSDAPVQRILKGSCVDEPTCNEPSKKST